MKYATAWTCVSFNNSADVIRLEELLADGWNPFAVIPYSTYTTGGFTTTQTWMYHLKRCVDDVPPPPPPPSE